LVSRCWFQKPHEHSDSESPRAAAQGILAKASEKSDGKDTHHETLQTKDGVDPAGSPSATPEVNTRDAQNQSGAVSVTRVVRLMKCLFSD
jgi:hypothetical protein